MLAPIKLHRLHNYDYASPGAYFITICTHFKHSTLGQATTSGTIILSPAGNVAVEMWHTLSLRFSHLQLDQFVVMPNHVHGIIWLETHPSSLARHASPLQVRQRGLVSGSLGAAVASFKSATTAAINRNRRSQGAPIWQRNYYDHIIRNDNALYYARRYILENPLKWSLDPDNPTLSSHKALTTTSSSHPHW